MNLGSLKLCTAVWSTHAALACMLAFLHAYRVSLVHFFFVAERHPMIAMDLSPWTHPPNTLSVA